MKVNDVDTHLIKCSMKTINQALNILSPNFCNIIFQQNKINVFCICLSTDFEFILFNIQILNNFGLLS